MKSYTSIKPDVIMPKVLAFETRTFGIPTSGFMKGTVFLLTFHTKPSHFQHVVFINIFLFFIRNWYSTFWQITIEI